jgi:predicted kinase
VAGPERPPRKRGDDVQRPAGGARDRRRDLELAVLMGLPAAGKSTFYRLRLAASHAHVSMDALARAGDKRRAQRRLIEDTLARGRSVAVDNVNATRADRAELIAMAAAGGARVVGYWLDASTRECAGRNRGRTGPAHVPPVAIFTAAKRFEPPSRSEGFAALWRVQATGTAEAPEFAIEPFEG